MKDTVRWIVDNRGLTSSSSPQELMGEHWVSARWREEKGGLLRPVPGSRMSRTAISGSCRAEADRPNIWAYSSDTTQWIYTTEGQAGKTNPQHPPDVTKVPWSARGHPRTARQSYQHPHGVGERQHPSLTSLRRRLVSNRPGVHSPHQHENSLFAFHDSLAPFPGCWLQVSQVLPIYAGKEAADTCSRSGTFLAATGANLSPYRSRGPQTSLNSLG